MATYAKTISELKEAIAQEIEWKMRQKKSSEMEFQSTYWKEDLPEELEELDEL